MTDATAVADFALKALEAIERLAAAGVAYNEAIGRVRAVIEKAQAESRDPTEDEWNTLNAEGDAAAAELHAKATGP